jgi:hypothetical protein
MRNLLFVAVISLAILACNQAENKNDGASNKSADMKALYEKNLATLKAGIAAFEKEDIEGWAATIADTAVWISPAYGDMDTTKKHWKESLAYYMANWDNLKLNNANFLPGIDADTHEFDGSVRYYGQWDGVHKSGKKTSVNFYGTYNFNADNKIIFGADYFDLGGLLNEVNKQ